MTETRHVIMHYHIFKNAGTTMDVILKKNFGAQWGGVEGPAGTYRLNNAGLLNFIQENPQLRAISSHEARPPLPDAPGLCLHPLLFLRHPIDRIGSIYAYRRALPEISTRSTKVAKEADLAGYIAWCLANPGAETVLNFQTTFLSCTGLETSPLNKPEPQVALQRLHELAFFGLVESFDESIRRLQESLLEAFGTLDLSHSVENRSRGRNASLAERLGTIEAALGPGLYAELLEKNELDLELYAQAVKIFEGRG